MNRSRLLLLTFALIGVSAASAHAQCTTTPVPCVFPPGSCAYVNLGPGSNYAGGDALRLSDFESSTDCVSLPGGGLTDVQVVHGTAVLTWTPFGGSPSLAGGPVVLTIEVVGGPIGNPRPFFVELLAMDLSGVAIPGGVLVRESPSKASPGQSNRIATPITRVADTIKVGRAFGRITRQIIRPFPGTNRSGRHDEFSFANFEKFSPCIRATLAN